MAIAVKPRREENTAMKNVFGEAIVTTTLGDLVESVMEASLEVIDDEKEASVIAGIVLNNILKYSARSALLLDHRSRQLRDA
jgi:hypothetical protein